MSDKNNLMNLLSALSKNMSSEELVFASIASDIATAISSKRIEMGLTQAELADLLGKKQATISGWERADCNFQLKTLIEIAQKLNLTLQVSLENNHAKTAPQKVLQFPGTYVGEISESPVWVCSFDEDLKEM